jgi:Right handed beta helix region
VTGTIARRPSRRSGLVIAVGGVASLAILAAIAGTVLSPAPPPSVPPVGSPAGPNPLPTATPAPTRAVVEVPPSIDATGASDVADQLQAVIDAAPDDAVIRLGTNATYRVETALVLDRRTGLEIDGRGATLMLVESDRSRRRNLWLVDATSIEIHDLTLVGSNPDPGVLNEDRQFEHGIWVDGGGSIKVERVTIENPWGDCLYLGDRDGRLPWVDGLVLRDSTCQGAGRNGVSIVAGRNVRIEGNTFGGIGLHAVDIEPNRTEQVQGADRVAVTGNRVDGPVADYFFAANGWGPIGNLTVEDNVLSGVALRMTVAPVKGSGYIRRAVRVADNRSDTAFQGDGAAALQFRDVIGLTVTGNVVPLDGGGAALVQVDDSCQVTISGNRFPGGATEWQGSIGQCPIESPA